MRVLLVLLLCLITAGCRSHPRKSRETALLRAEILDLEDKYYLLKSKYENVIGQLEGSELVSSSFVDGQAVYEDGVIYEGLEIESAPVESSQPTLGPGDSSSLSPGRSNFGSIVAEPTNSRTLTRPKLPKRLLDSRNRASQADSRGNSNQSHLALNPPSNKHLQDIDLAFPRSSNADAAITTVEIEPRSTQGRDIDGAPGDEGIDVFVQCKTTDGEFEYHAGELTVSIIDPEETPDRQRVGLWKFLPEETKLFFAKDDRGHRGILLHLPWDQSTPIHERLALHVRFITSDGRVLKTSGKIRITPPKTDYDPLDADVVQWTRTDPRWIPESIPQASHQGESPREHRPGQLTTNPAGRSGEDFRPKRHPIRAIPAKTEINRPAWRPVR